MAVRQTPVCHIFPDSQFCALAPTLLPQTYLLDPRFNQLAVWDARVPFGVRQVGWAKANRSCHMVSCCCTMRLLASTGGLCFPQPVHIDLPHHLLAFCLQPFRWRAPMTRWMRGWSSMAGSASPRPSAQVGRAASLHIARWGQLLQGSCSICIPAGLKVKDTRAGQLCTCSCIQNNDHYWPSDPCLQARSARRRRPPRYKQPWTQCMPPWPSCRRRSAQSRYGCR